MEYTRIHRRIHLEYSRNTAHGIQRVEYTRIQLKYIEIHRLTLDAPRVRRRLSTPPRPASTSKILHHNNVEIQSEYNSNTNGIHSNTPPRNTVRILLISYWNTSKYSKYSRNTTLSIPPRIPAVFPPYSMYSAATHVFRETAFVAHVFCVFHNVFWSLIYSFVSRYMKSADLLYK